MVVHVLVFRPGQRRSASQNRPPPADSRGVRARAEANGGGKGRARQGEASYQWRRRDVSVTHAPLGCLAEKRDTLPGEEKGQRRYQSQLLLTTAKLLTTTSYNGDVTSHQYAGCRRRSKQIRKCFSFFVTPTHPLYHQNYRFIRTYSDNTHITR